MQKPTIIIIGGGVIGLSTAYHLARRSFGRIVLLEKETVGDGASSQAAGIITGLLWTETGVEVRKISLARFRELSDELDEYRYQDVGCLNLFSEEEWPDRKALLPLYDRLDFNYKILDSAEMRNRWPALSLPDGITGLFDPLGGYSEPDHYVPALARKCLELGVDIREHQQVRGFLDRSGRIAGVKTQAGDVEGDFVVSTVHVWTLKVFEQIGWTLPLKSFTHQRYVTTPLETEVNIPAVNANPFGGYIRPHHGKRLLAGIESPDAFEFKVPGLSFRMEKVLPDPGLKHIAAKNLLSLVPGAGQPDWEFERKGLLSFSMDGEPVLGPIRALPGLFVGVAFHSGGFAYNPAAGVLLADYVADGVPRINVNAFSPDRFNDAETSDFMNSTITQGEYSGLKGKRRH